LNRNVDNYFAETEQSAFSPGNVVPGIDFSNDPVLQGRLAAYLPAHYHRLGPNFQQLPINKPICPFHNNQRRGGNNFTIDVDRVWYHENSMANNTPYTVPPEEGGYEHYHEKVEGRKIRARSESFKDYFTQPRIFWNSMTAIEKQHLIEALSYQIGRVEREFVRQQAVNLLVKVDREMAYTVADNVGVDHPSGTNVPVSTSYPSLSIFSTPSYAYTQKVGVLIGNGFNGQEVTSVLNYLQQCGIFIDIVSETLGTVTGADGTTIEVNQTFLTTSPYLLDSIYIVGGSSKNDAKFYQDIMHYINVAYKHYKPIGVATNAQSYIPTSKGNNLAGVVFAANNPNFGKEFAESVAIQR